MLTIRELLRSSNVAIEGQVVVVSDTRETMQKAFGGNWRERIEVSTPFLFDAVMNSLVTLSTVATPQYRGACAKDGKPGPWSYVTVIDDWALPGIAVEVSGVRIMTFGPNGSLVPVFVVEANEFRNELARALNGIAVTLSSRLGDASNKTMDMRARERRDI